METIEETDDRFYINKSTLSHGGLGVFAKVPIKKGECLEVIGVMVSKNGISEKCTRYADDYKFAAADKNADKHIVPMGYAAILNHAIDQKSMNMCMIYDKGRSKKSPHASSLVLKAIRDIDKDEECLHYYGEGWNKTLEWKTSAISIADEEKMQWDKFMSHKLYNLDFFDQLGK